MANCSTSVIAESMEFSVPRVVLGPSLGSMYNGNNLVDLYSFSGFANSVCLVKLLKSQFFFFFFNLQKGASSRMNFLRLL